MFLVHQHDGTSEQILSFTAEQAAAFIAMKNIFEWNYHTVTKELTLLRSSDIVVVTVEHEPEPGTQEYFDLHGTHASEDHWEPEYAIAISHRGVALCQSIDDPILIIKF